MSTWAKLRAGPVARLSLGLIALVISLLMLADMLLGVAPDRGDLERQLRQRSSESLAIQITTLLESGDDGTLSKTIQQVISRNPDILSIAVRRAEGSIVAQGGDHARHWIAPQTGRSTVNHVRVPVYADRNHWGDVEMTFAPAGVRTFRNWITEPTILFVALVGIGGFLLFYAYLRRAMQYLDPSATVPDRVRKAFDALTDGLLILDRQGRIVLANHAFRNLHPMADRELNGLPISELRWLRTNGERSDEAPAPWTRALRDANAVTGEALSIAQPDGGQTETIVNCSPIADAQGRMRGCLVTFDDVTEIHRKNEEMGRMLAELDRTRAEIARQNEELRHLAERDSLTGCLNRRAFFQAVAGVFEPALRNNANLCCIMADIDHFKGFNDLYGHAVGDQVIQVVARMLAGKLRVTDILCRYGGEEFCLILPDTTPEEGCAIAERMRASIEKNGSAAIRNVDVSAITVSFGVACLADGATRIEELVNEADNALYSSKEGGRNRVTLWKRKFG
jgi:diguanylate cyclase (GGDEF)-like protein/PAS domain S-box-containing protein